MNASMQRWGVPIDDGPRASDIGIGVVPSTETVGVVDLFTLALVRTAPASADLVMAWDRTRVRIPIVLLAGSS